MVKQLCSATTRGGEPCRNFAMSNGLCRQHGGADSPAQAGRYAEALPERLWENFRAALEDVDLLRLRNEIALLDSHISDLLGQVEDNPAERWPEIIKLLAERRRLVDSERKGLAIDGAVMSREQATQLVQALLASIRRHVTNADFLRRIADDFDKLMGGA